MYLSLTVFGFTLSLSFGRTEEGDEGDTEVYPDLTSVDRYEV